MDFLSVTQVKNPNEIKIWLTLEHFIVFFLLGKLSFPRMVRPLEWAPIGLPLKEVAVHAGHKLLIEADPLIIDNPQYI